MTADELLSVFDEAAKAARTAVEPLTGAARRARTERPGQYALDLVADAAVLPVLYEADVAVVSEESVPKVMTNHRVENGLLYRALT